MNKLLLALVSMCLLLCACAPFKATEYNSANGNYNNFKKNFSFSIPHGYVLLEGEEKEMMHQNFSAFAPKDSDYFFNKEKQIILVCFKGETFDLPIGTNKKEVFTTALRAVRFELENNFRDHPYIKIKEVSNIDNFISVDGTYNSGMVDSIIKYKISLYPISKLSSTHAIFFLGMGILQKK